MNESSGYFSGTGRQNMNLIKKLVVLIASMGAIGSALAGATQQTDFFAASGVSGAYSFADLFDFSIGAEQQTLLASAVSFTPSGMSVDATHVGDLTITIYGGASDYSYRPASGSFSAEVSGLAGGQVGGGYQFSVAAVPEPSGWMMLLAGFAVVGFMARRKASLITS